MSSDETVSFSLEINVQEGILALRQFTAVMSRSLSLLNRFAGTEDAKEAIAQTQKLIMIMNQARLAILALRAAMFLGAGPMGWALAGVATASLMINAVDVTESFIDADRGD